VSDIAAALTAVAALALLGCGLHREESSGSLIDPPRVWEAARDGDEWVASGPALPPDTISVTLLAELADRRGADDFLSFGVSDFDGRVMVDATRPELSLNRILRGRGVVVGMLPSSTAALPLSENFRVGAVRLDTVGAPDERSIQVTAWIKRSGRDAAEIPARQDLRLAVFVIGQHAIDEQDLSIALGELGRIWRGGGIEIKEPARLRVDGDEGARHERLEIDPALGNDSPALGALLALSARAPAETLSLFVVGDIVLGGPGLSLWALSGAIPVPPLPGSPRSGVAFNGGVLAVDPIWAGQVMAHEIGHALGLYHTTERQALATSPSGPRAAIHDPLDDTAACPLEADADGDHVLSARECGPHDAANLMFWSAERDGTRLTRNQGEQARRAAIVR